MVHCLESLRDTDSPRRLSVPPLRIPHRLMLAFSGRGAALRPSQLRQVRRSMNRWTRVLFAVLAMLAAASAALLFGVRISYGGVGGAVILCLLAAVALQALGVSVLVGAAVSDDEQ